MCKRTVVSFTIFRHDIFVDNTLYKSRIYPVFIACNPCFSIPLAVENYFIKR